ncbi:hypothetical protein WR25_24286 [Diploscapter pachys]|uniref:Uncharacterized protein n=1 Tax=Diploscapter pachys TaxID=2018661 RepID=A0A2A2K723_9BILA|nr:hypothetical protein WR25_24286 [Diploscapter pachys]
MLAIGGSTDTLTLPPSLRATKRRAFRLTSSESGLTRNGLLSSPPSSLNCGSGSMTSDRAESCSLLVLSACCTFGDRLVFTVAAWTDSDKGSNRPANNSGRSVLIINGQTLQARGKDNGAV